MSDDIYKKLDEPDKRRGEYYDKEKYAARMKQQRAALAELTEKTLAQMQKDNAAFRRYLITQGRFNRYSVNNAALVSAQFPEATELHSYGEWRKKCRVYVDKDATKVLVLEAGKIYKRADGTSAQGFDVKTLYDVSQTSAKHDPAEQEPLSLDDLLYSVMKSSHAKCKPIDELPEPEVAIYNAEKNQIFLRKNQSNRSLLENIPREVAAAVFDEKYEEPRQESHYKCCCVATMLAAHYGVDDVMPPELPEEYQTMTPDEFKAQLEMMRDILNEIQSDVHYQLGEIEEEKKKKEAAKAT